MSREDKSSRPPLPQSTGAEREQGNAREKREINAEKWKQSWKTNQEEERCSAQRGGSRTSRGRVAKGNGLREALTKKGK